MAILGGVSGRSPDQGGGERLRKFFRNCVPLSRMQDSASLGVISGATDERSRKVQVEMIRGQVRASVVCFMQITYKGGT
jgi:hypothetical protein